MTRPLSLSLSQGFVFCCVLLYLDDIKLSMGLMSFFFCFILTYLIYLNFFRLGCWWALAFSRELSRDNKHYGFTQASKFPCGSYLQHETNKRIHKFSSPQVKGSSHTPLNTFSFSFCLPSILHVWLQACGDLEVNNGHIWFLSFLAFLTNALECCLITSCTPFK